MAEAIATLALASSIFQVVDFGTKFVSTAWKIYRGRGADRVESLLSTSTSLRDVLKTIRAQTSANDQASDSDRATASLARDCASLVEEILRSLDKLDLDNARRKRDAIRAAVKLMCEREEISAFHMRLGEYRSQLTLNLLSSLRQYASQSLAQQDAILKGLQDLNSDPWRSQATPNKPNDSPEAFGSSVLKFLTSNLNRDKQTRERRLLLKDLIQVIREDSSTRQGNRGGFTDIAVSDKTRESCLDGLLASLEYNGMQDREGRISLAHEKTFQWILQDEDNKKWSNFKKWLLSDEKLYWITGKAGSGKSTLMKYICFPPKSTGAQAAVPRCHEHLQTWSGNRKLMIASFYFWNSGVQEQMSRTGLLITLLHQILKTCPDLAPLACPDRWEAFLLFAEDFQEWTEQELQDTLLRAVEKFGELDGNIAFFVDGLDEFEDKPEELVSFFQQICDFSNIKVCVASRPWNQFQDAFGHKPSLKLEDLTYDDIKSYVTSKFNAEPMFEQLRLLEKEFADQLIEEIISKAAGVFLWVTLVVSSLLSGMTFGDKISVLKERLDLLPPDLSDLYNKILSNLDPFYMKQTAQLFRLVESCRRPMNLLFAWFVDSDGLDSPLRREIRHLSEDEIKTRMQAMRRRINSQTKGLLEVTRPSLTPGEVKDDVSDHRLWTIQYLHRTVRDFIKERKVSAHLSSAMDPDFDPHLRLLAGSLAYVKALDMGTLTMSTLWNTHFNDCLLYARDVRRNSVRSMILLLDELKRVGPGLILGCRSTSQRLRAMQQVAMWDDPWENGLLHITSARVMFVESHQVTWSPNAGSYGCLSFLSLATRFRIIEYVRVKAKSDCLTRIARFSYSSGKFKTCSWPLLLDALHSDNDRHPSATIARLLIDKGADPSYIVEPKGWSPLIIAVSTCIHDWEYPISRWMELSRLFVRKGEIDPYNLDGIINEVWEREWRPKNPTTRREEKIRASQRRKGRKTVANVTSAFRAAVGFVGRGGIRKLIWHALQELARGGIPDFERLEDEICGLD